MFSQFEGVRSPAADMLRLSAELVYMPHRRRLCARNMYDVSRAEMEQFALISHQKAVTAQKEGRFEREVPTVTLPSSIPTESASD